MKVDIGGVGSQPKKAVTGAIFPRCNEGRLFSGL